eukprot:5800486-Amphidinium_carterae.1
MEGSKAVRICGTTHQTYPSHPKILQHVPSGSHSGNEVHMHLYSPEDNINCLCHDEQPQVRELKQQNAPSAQSDAYVVKDPAVVVGSFPHACCGRTL